MVGREDELLFALSVSFARTVQLRSAVPAQTATLRPDVFPFDFQRIQRTFDPVPTEGLELYRRKPATTRTIPLKLFRLLLTRTSYLRCMPCERASFSRTWLEKARCSSPEAFMIVRRSE